MKNRNCHTANIRADIRNWITPVILFFLSFVIRLVFISKGPFHVDTLNLAIKAERFATTFDLQPLFGSGYPLTVILGGLCVALGKLLGFHDPIICVNFMSVLTSALSVLFLFFVAEKLYSRVSATVTASLFSITPIVLGLSVYGKSHAPSLMFLFLSLYCLILFREGGRRPLLILSALFLGSMGACRLQDMVLMIVPVSVMFCFLKIPSFGATDAADTTIQRKPGLVADFSVYWMFVFCVVFLFHSPFLMGLQSSGYHQQWTSFFKQGVTDNYMGLMSEGMRYSFGFILTSTTILGMGLAVIGGVVTFLRNRSLAMFLLIWFGVPYLFYGNLWTTVPRFFALLLPAIFLPMGYALSLGLKRNVINKLTSLLMIFILVFVYIGSIVPRIHFRSANALLPDFCRWVQRVTEPNAYIISGDDDVFFNYYSHRHTLPKPLNAFELPQKDLDLFKESLDALLRDNTPVYVTGNGLYNYDPEKKFSSFLESNYRLDDIGSHMYEDWHRGEQVIRVYPVNLFRISFAELSSRP